MEHLQTPEAKAKALETIANNLPQISNQEERESHITMDHYTKEVVLYTNNIATINRLARKGLTHSHEVTLDGQVYSREYTVSFKDMSKLMQVGLYK